MKRILTYSLAALSLAALVAFAGCSSESSPTGGGGLTGDPNDPNFLAVQDLFDEANVAGSWEATLELSIVLIELQFVTPISERRWSHPHAAAAPDFDIVDGSYTLDSASGWHVFGVDYVASDEGDIYSGTAYDSLRFWLNGAPLLDEDVEGLNGFDDIDSMEIAIKNTWRDGDLDCVWESSERYTLTTIPFDLGWSLVINGSSHEEFQAGLGCIDDSCTLSLISDVNLNGITFPFAQFSEDCPIEGSLSVTSDIDLQCEGTSSFGYHTLDINGMWTASLEVDTNGDLSISYSDGTSVWSETELCIMVSKAFSSGGGIRK